MIPAHYAAREQQARRGNDPHSTRPSEDEVIDAVISRINRLRAEHGSEPIPEEELQQIVREGA